MVLPILTLLLVILAHMNAEHLRCDPFGDVQPLCRNVHLESESEGRVVMRQALPNAIGPIASVVALNLAYLISGVVVIEVVFVYPGVGQSMIDAVKKPGRSRDPGLRAGFCHRLYRFQPDRHIISIVSNPRLLHPR